jgi:hypothetical protein
METAGNTVSEMDPRELLLINLSRHGLDRVGQRWSFQLHRYSDGPPLSAMAGRFTAALGRGGQSA